MNTIIRIIENALYPFRVINSYFSRVFKRAGGKTLRMSMAGKIAVAFFLCFAIFITTMLVIGIYDKTQFWVSDISQTGKDWVNFILYYLIALAISIAVYWGVRLATREKPSLYPEIDQCWTPIEKWREKQNVDWDDFRRYLVIGSNLETSNAMHADMKDKKLGPQPTGANEWMHWYGTNSNQYLHLKKITNTNQKIERLQSGSSRGGLAVDPTNTLQASIGVPDWSASIGMDDVTAEVDGSFGASAGSFGGSLDPTDSLDPYDSASMIKPDIEGAAAEDDPDAEEELNEDGDTPNDRVRYLCQLIRRKTEGQMPFHGVVVVIPFDKFMTRENFKTITAAVKQDLMELRNESDVSFPVSVVFSSMEKDEGFPKLQNLLGAQRAGSGRFGAGCRTEDIPVIDPTNIDIQVHRACKSFEDWVTNRWGKGSQLSRAAQNKELFKLIVRVRQKFQPKLMHLLENALIWTPSESPDGESTDLILAGCYFCSTGDHAADRGFLNGVFLKCEEFGQTASWGEEIISRDRGYSLMGTLLFAFATVTIIGMVIAAFYF